MKLLELLAKTANIPIAQVILLFYYCGNNGIDGFLDSFTTF